MSNGWKDPEEVGCFFILLAIAFCISALGINAIIEALAG